MATAKDASKDPNATVDPVTGLITSVDPETSVITETDPVTKKVTVTDPSNPGFTPAYLTALATALQPYLANLAPVRAPRIDTVTPTSGKAGDIVEVTGHAFMGGHVSLSGVPCDDVIITDNKITFAVPSGAPNGAIVVRRGPMRAVSGTFVTGFMPSTEPLAIKSISPETGLVGSTISIVGTGLGGVRRVQVGTTPAKFITHSDASMDVIVPVNGDNGPVIVDNGVFSTESLDSFTVIEAPKPAPSPPAPKPAAPVNTGKPATGAPANK